MIKGQASHWTRPFGTGQNSRPEQNLSQRKKRKCLMHGGDFLSDGPGHRICNKCKQTAQWRIGTTKL